MKTNPTDEQREMAAMRAMTIPEEIELAAGKTMRLPTLGSSAICDQAGITVVADCIRGNLEAVDKAGDTELCTAAYILSEPQRARQMLLAGPESLRDDAVNWGCGMGMEALIAIRGLLRQLAVMHDLTQFDVEARQEQVDPDRPPKSSSRHSWLGKLAWWRKKPGGPST
jgi:hypothetical protein